MTEYTQPIPGEEAPSPEAEAPLALDALPAQLGLAESPRMMDARAAFIAATDAEDRRRFAIEYSRLGQELAGRHAGPAYAKAQVALIVANALNWRDVGNTDSYRENLEDARLYAEYEGLTAVAQTLEAELARGE